MNTYRQYTVMLLMFFIPFFFHSFVNAAAVNLGILSDSGSDEYRADDNRGGSYGTTTLIWNELLVKYRGVNIGSWGSRSEPRRTGFEYNWARSGATSVTLISSGQHTGLAQQVRSGLINIVYVSIGTNDFAYYGDGAAIYNGSIFGQTLQNKITNVISNITLTVDTIKNENQTIPIILVTTGDMGNFSYWKTQFPDAAKRLKVTNAIEQTNQGIRAIASTHQHIVLIEGIDLLADVFGGLNASGNLVVGGETVTFASNGDEPHHAILSDNIHSGTVIDSFIANKIITLINQGLGTQIALFTPTEMLENSGIRAAAQKKGDGNGDGKVNGLDYIIWLTNFGTTTTQKATHGDFNGDGSVNGLDYTTWLTNFGL